MSLTFGGYLLYSHYHTNMKTLFTLATLTAAVLATSAMAAPEIKPSDISEDALKEIATERQRASMEAHEKAKAKAEEEREKAIQEAKDITARNDAGMKKTIQRRHLNNMLPPCDREPEKPREPGDYHIRY